MVRNLSHFCKDVLGIVREDVAEDIFNRQVAKSTKKKYFALLVCKSLRMNS